MLLSACQRYWSEVVHEGPRGWTLYFKPVKFNSHTEVRWGFPSPQAAARAKALLVMEHFVEEECVGK